MSKIAEQVKDRMGVVETQVRELMRTQLGIENDAIKAVYQIFFNIAIVELNNGEQYKVEW